MAGLLANGRDPARCHIVKRSVATEEETRLPPFSFENTRVDPSTHLPGRSIQEHLPIDSPPEAEPCRSPGQIQDQGGAHFGLSPPTPRAPAPPQAFGGQGALAELWELWLAEFWELWELWEVRPGAGLLKNADGRALQALRHGAERGQGAEGPSSAGSPALGCEPERGQGAEGPSSASSRARAELASSRARAELWININIRGRDRYRWFLRRRLWIFARTLRRRHCGGGARVAVTIQGTILSGCDTAGGVVTSSPGWGCDRCPPKKQILPKTPPFRRSRTPHPHAPKTLKNILKRP